MKAINREICRGICILLGLITLILPVTGESRIMVKSQWNNRTFEKQLLIKCGRDNEIVESEEELENHHRFCMEICSNEKSCTIKEGLCRDCGGTGTIMHTIFSEMSKRYRNSGEEISLDEFSDFLTRGDFVSFNSKSIYNFVTSYDHPSVRLRFQRLCEYKDPYPIVFFSVEPVGRKIKDVIYVICQMETIVVPENTELPPGAGEGDLVELDVTPQILREFRVYRMIAKFDVVVNESSE